METNSIAQSKVDEISVLGTIMYSSGVFSRVYGTLRVDDFYYPVHRYIYGVMHQLYEKKLDINYRTVWNELYKKNYSEITETELEEYLDYRVDTEAAMALASQISEFAGYRMLHRDLDSLLPSVQQRNKSLIEYASDLNGLMKRISGKGMSNSFMTGEDLADAYLTMLSRGRGNNPLTGYDKIDKKLYDFDAKEITIIAARPGTGKALSASERVLTPYGWVMIKDVTVGSQVMGSDGLPHSVLGVYPQGLKQEYAVFFSDDTSVKCDLNHLWGVTVDGQYEVVTTEQLYSENREFDVSLVKAIEVDDNAGPLVDKYYELGRNFAEEELEEVLLLSKRMRLAYLQGVLDVRGNCGTDGVVGVVGGTNGILDLIRSLGGYAYFVGCGKSITAYFSDPKIPPFRDETKLEKVIYQERKKRVTGVYPLHTYSEMICIAVDAPDNLFVTEGYTLTHNTAMMLQSARLNLEQGKRVGFLSMEMDSTKLLNRLISSRVKIDSSILRGMSPEEFSRDKKLAEALKFFATQPLFIEDRGPFTVDSVSQKIRTLVYEHDCDIIYVDYIGLINAPGDKRTDQITTISRELKSLASELDIPLVVASQLNRETTKNYSGRPQLENLRDSGAIEQDASIVIFLYPDVDRMKLGGLTDDAVDKYMETQINLPIKFEIAKQRNGPTFVEDMIFQKPHGQFELKEDVYRSY